jgi:hypothetical protein
LVLLAKPPRARNGALATRPESPPMPEVRRERISGVDTAWLRMDLPTNPMVIVGVLMFEGRLDAKQVRRTLERRFLAFRRFRQKAVQDPTGAWWEDGRLQSNRTSPAGAAGQAGKAELQAQSDLARRRSTTQAAWQFHLWTTTTAARS